MGGQMTRTARIDDRDQAEGRALSDLADIELVALLHRGSRWALAPLFEKHHAGCVQFARRLVSEAEAEDVVSEAFIAMVAAIDHDCGPRTSVRAYLHQAIWSRSTRRWSRREDPVDAFDGGVEGFVDPLSAHGERLGDRTDLAAAMATLSPRWRDVIWMVEVEGRSMVEVGELLDIAPPAAASLVYRARKALREAYFREVYVEVPDDATVALAA